MKNKPIITGIIAAASPIPAYNFTIFWCLVWFLGIGVGLLNYDTIPQWMVVCALLPWLISPSLGLLGIVHGVVKIKTKRAWLGVLLSIIGLSENFALIYISYYLGSRF